MLVLCVIGITLFLVAADAAGTCLKHYRAIDHRHASSLQLSDVRLEASAVIGEVGAGFALLDLAVDHSVMATLAVSSARPIGGVTRTRYARSMSMKGETWKALSTDCRIGPAPSLTGIR